MTAVRTVLGEVDSAQLGMTLFHEHLLLDAGPAWHPPAPGDAEGARIAAEPVRLEFLGRLRDDPYLSSDNVVLDDAAVAVAELGRFTAAGGQTVVEATPEGAGRDPEGLRRIARDSGVTVVMGAGFYLERTHPAWLRGASVEAVAEHLERDVTDGVGGIRAGVIGEIGVSPSFTTAETLVLRGAARAQARTGVPLSVHLPGWARLGHRVLDVVAEEGGALPGTVLCHLNPSHDDPDYQVSLAERGAWLAYDMLGMPFSFPGEGECPSDADSARAVTALVRGGFRDRLLLSGDVFLKTMLAAYGGNGYGHVPARFVPRLHRHGLTAADTHALLVTNPRTVFETAARTADADGGPRGVTNRNESGSGSSSDAAARRKGAAAQ